MIKIKKKLLFGITSLDFGGAERVLVDLVNKISSEYEISIFTIYGNGELQDELLNQINVKSLYSEKFSSLNRVQRIMSVLKILLFSKHIYNKYIADDSDIQIAFLEGPITRLFSNNKKKKKIAWIHNDIKSVFGNGMKAYIKKKIDNKTYKKYNRLVFVSKDNMEAFKDEYKDISAKKMEVIYNYIDAELIRKKAEVNNVLETFKQDDNFKLVTVCRLVEQKAIDRFIDVHRRLIKEGYKHSVYIVGDGPEYGKIAEYIKANNVEESFILLGKNKNPYPYIKEADAFCLLSYYEGYGMVLEEAKILNKYIIITDTAAREAVNNYPYKKILNNSESGIYDGLKETIRDTKKNIERSGYKYININRLNRVYELIEKI